MFIFLKLCLAVAFAMTPVMPSKACYQRLLGEAYEDTPLVRVFSAALEGNILLPQMGDAVMFFVFDTVLKPENRQLFNSPVVPELPKKLLLKWTEIANRAHKVNDIGKVVAVSKLPQLWSNFFNGNHQHFMNWMRHFLPAGKKDLEIGPYLRGAYSEEDNQIFENSLEQIQIIALAYITNAETPEAQALSAEYRQNISQEIRQRFGNTRAVGSRYAEKFRNGTIEILKKMGRYDLANFLETLPLQH